MFSPIDAYAASFRSDGAVVSELADPTLVPTVVVNFVLVQDGVGDRFDAVYHENQDLWEVFDHYKRVTVARPGHQLYELANQTVDAHRSKLLSGPCPKSLHDRLTQKLADEMREEIDRDIISDLRRNVPGHSEPEFELTLSPPPGANRKLTPKWSLDKDELKGPEVILYSTIFKP